jgi:uncharacterized protein (TIGR01319 family)
MRGGAPAPARPDLLTVEVGSTITKVNAFARESGAFTHLAQGFATTTVAEGDVGIGVRAAMARLAAGGRAVAQAPETFVTSSAAGGLRMTVHGLTASMTARAAREASLGAGAIVRQVTVGPLDEHDLAETADLSPTIILLAGGVDHGERAVVLGNARALAALARDRLPGRPPVVYAGNVAVRAQVAQIFAEAGVELLLADNVFPDVDVLVVEPLRALIQEVFSRQIVHAPGMAALAALTRAEILPTPGAVLRGAELFAEANGDCVVIDVGGATTDVHSVTDGSPQLQAQQLDPEPRSKRTVEGDLGVFVNARNVIEATGEQAMRDRLGDLRAMPASGAEVDLTRWLCARAVELGVRRHAGVLIDLHTPTGKKQVVKGRDLTAVRWVVGTGGALTRVAGSAQSLRAVRGGMGRSLMPPQDARIVLDQRYVFSALGALAQAYPDEVRETFARWAAAAPQD